MQLARIVLPPNCSQFSIDARSWWLGAFFQVNGAGFHESTESTLQAGAFDDQFSALGNFADSFFEIKENLGTGMGCRGGNGTEILFEFPFLPMGFSCGRNFLGQRIASRRFPSAPGTVLESHQVAGSFPAWRSWFFRAGTASSQQVV